MRTKAISLFMLLFLPAIACFAQVEEARQAIERGEYVRAVNILSEALATRPSPDAYRYLGIAYANMREYKQAEDVLLEGSERYPDDSRFHDELAGVYLANNDVERAKSALRRALDINSGDKYASDLLATIDMSEGRVQAALQAWNENGRPIVADILHNYNLNFGSWVVPQSLAFRPAGVLRYSEWKTTERRLWETENFTNVALEIEPTPLPDQYNAVVRTSPKTNTRTDLLWGFLRGAPLKTSYLDLWNIRNSGLNFNGQYRWDANRRRMDGHFKIPLPIASLLYVDFGDTWRSEQWDVSSVIRSEFSDRARFRYKSNALRMQLKHIPHYRVELGVGLEYTNRAASGDLPQLFLNSQNSGKLEAHTSLRLATDGYQNRLHVKGFLARRSILGDLDFSGGIAELNNRWEISAQRLSYIDWTLKAGASRGQLPLEEYFVLGLDTHPQHILRGHATHRDSRYGRSPMGAGFLLMNLDFERRIVTLPLFNALNIPFLTVKWEVFVDAAKTFDRTRVMQQGKLWIDTGASLKFESPSHSFNLVFGRSVRDGTGTLMGYIERRFW